MALKVYISGMSGNKEVKKRQQRVLMILDSKNIKYEIVDITEPGKESEKDTMQTKSTRNGATVSDPSPRHPLPPQLFNDAEYCGDYDAFDLANEIDTLEEFLKVAPTERTSVSTAKIELKKENGVTATGETTEAVETPTAADEEGDSKEVAADSDDTKNGKANEEEEEAVVEVTALPPTNEVVSAPEQQKDKGDNNESIVKATEDPVKLESEGLITSEKVAASN